MSSQDLENQPANLRHSADARIDTVEAETVQKHPNKAWFGAWFGSFCRRRQNQSADSRGRAPDAGSEAFEDENRRPSITSAEIASPQFKIGRNKLNAKDGYTTHSFNKVPRPVPVEDIFISSRTLITLRLIFRVPILLFAGYTFFTSVPGPNLWLVTVMALLFRKFGIHRIGSVGIPTVQQLWSFHRYPQRFWEIIAKLCLSRRHIVRFWWLIYLLISDISDFEQNFLNAWSQRPGDTLPTHNSEEDSSTQADERTERDAVAPDARNILANKVRQLTKIFRQVYRIFAEIGESFYLHRSSLGQGDLDEQLVVDEPTSTSRGLVHIFVGHEHLNAPILSDGIVDSALLEQLRMFYRFLKVKQGLVELIIPRILVRINCVKLEEVTQMADEITGPLDCGRGLHLFHDPKTATNAQVISNKVQELANVTDPEGLEFIRVLDRNAISGVITAPPLASLVFVVVWLSIFLRETEENKGNVDTQVVVTTAFTIAIYLVTAGALITGLVAYLDNNLRESEASGKEKQHVETT